VLAAGGRGGVFLSVNGRVLGLSGGFATGLAAVGWLRLQGGSSGVVGALSAHATLIYVLLTFAAAFLLVRSGVPLLGFGFRPRIGARHLVLALAGVGLLQLGGSLLEPVWERVFGAGRDLSRFAVVNGSASQLLAALALAWTFAAFGEELAFRIVLLRSVAFALGDGRAAVAVALIVQAACFGVVHAYQGPAGIAGTVTSGLVYGALTLAARGSIWPAALAHGLGNTIGLFTIYAGHWGQ